MQIVGCMEALEADNFTVFISAVSLEIWEPQPLDTFRACSGLYRDWFTFSHHLKPLVQRVRIKGVTTIS